MLAPGRVLTLRIEKAAAGGRMIARSENGIVLVSGAIPGEQVSVRIERVGKGVAFAETLRVEEPSPDRRQPFTDPLCGGCLYAHIDYPRQVEIKSQVIADAFARIAHIPISAPIAVLPSRDDGYRMRGRLHVANGMVGFFREGSHQICDARQTRQLLPETSDVVEAIAAMLRQSQSQGVHAIELSESCDASQRVVHLETSGPVDRADLQAIGHSAGLTGLTASPAGLISGSPYVVDAIELAEGTMTLRHHVLAFFQGNRYLLADLIAHVLDQVAEGDHVVDLYAGAGLFSIAAAVARRATVTAVEGDPLAAADLMLNAAGLGGAVEAVHQPVERFVAAHRGANPALHRAGHRGGPAVLIVDPPRTGMSKEALAGAIRLQARTLVYVSCDVATLARDARALLDGGYELQHLRGFDLFPNTPHVEAAAVFRRRCSGEGREVRR